MTLKGIIFVLGVCVLYMLSRIVRATETRTRLEAARVAGDLGRRGPRHEVDDFDDELERELRIGWHEANASGSLIEWIEQVTGRLRADPADVRARLHSHQGDQLLPLLVLESFRRGVQSRFLNEADFEHLREFPGPEPVPEPWCSEYCYEQLKLDHYTPPGAEACPFCGGPWDMIDYNEDLPNWKLTAEKWERYRKVCPNDAFATEKQDRDARAQALEQRRVEFEAALALHRAKQTQEVGPA